MNQYDRLLAQVTAERAQIDADYEELAADHAAELERLRGIARDYRAILYGASTRGTLDPAAAAELDTVDARHGDALDQ